MDSRTETARERTADRYARLRDQLKAVNRLGEAALRRAAEFRATRQQSRALREALESWSFPADTPTDVRHEGPSDPFDEVLRLALREGATACAIWLYDPDGTPEIVAESGIHAESLTLLQSLCPGGAGAPNSRDGGPPGDGASPEGHAAELPALAGAVSVPIPVESRTVGCLLCVRHRPGLPFVASTVKAFERLARLAGEARHRQLLETRVRAAAEAKSSFLALVSHELRTPLTAIIGYADLIEQRLGQSSPEADAKRAGAIKASAWRLLELINEILAFSRMESGTDVVRRETFSLAGLLDEVRGPVEAVARQAGLEIRFQLEGPDEVATDRPKVLAILRNLVSNALKFTSQGDVLVSLDTGDDRLRIVVADSGVGMTDEQVETIFEPFWQAEPAATRQVGGAGLGLAVVQRAVDLLGGQLDVESEVGVGSTFTVSLPL